MITITGSTQRRFSFPGGLPSATAYYGDFDSILNYLPHIQLVTRYAPNQFRALYNTLELGVYHVRIYCDMQVHFDEAAQTLHVTPFYGPVPVRQSVTVHSLAAQGYFTSQSIFHARGHSTEIDYQLQLTASLPKPLGLMFIPDAVLNQVAASITDWRIDEIAAGFIERSIKAYGRSFSAHPARPELCPAALPRPAVRARPDRRIG